MATSRHYTSTSPVTGSGGASQPQRRTGQGATVRPTTSGAGASIAPVPSPPEPAPMPTTISGHQSAQQSAPVRFDQALLANAANVADAHSGTDATLLREGDWASLLGRLTDIFDNRGVATDYFGHEVAGTESGDARLRRILFEILGGQRTFDDVRGSVDQLAAEIARYDIPPSAIAIEEAEREAAEVIAQQELEGVQRELWDVWQSVGMTPDADELDRYAADVQDGRMSPEHAALYGVGHRIKQMWEHYGLDPDELGFEGLAYAYDIRDGNMTWEELAAIPREQVRAGAALPPEHVHALDEARSDLAHMLAEAHTAHEHGLSQVDIGVDRQLEELARALTDRRRQEMESLGGRGMAFQNRGRGVADRFREQDRQVARGQVSEWEQEQINQLAQALSGAQRQYDHGLGQVDSRQALWEQQAIADALAQFGTFAV